MRDKRDVIIRMTLNAFDEIDELEHENKFLRDRLSVLEKGVPEEVTRLTELDELVLKHGRKVIMKESLDYWHEVHYYEDEDSDEVNIESYEKWLKRCVKRDKIPDWCSLVEFYSYFDLELREMYETECKKTIAKVQKG